MSNWQCEVAAESMGGSDGAIASYVLSLLELEARDQVAKAIWLLMLSIGTSFVLWVVLHWHTDIPWWRFVPAALLLGGWLGSLRASSYHKLMNRSIEQFIEAQLERLIGKRPEADDGRDTSSASAKRLNRTMRLFDSSLVMASALITAWMILDLVEDAAQAGTSFLSLESNLETFAIVALLYALIAGMNGAYAFVTAMGWAISGRELYGVNANINPAQYFASKGWRRRWWQLYSPPQLGKRRRVHIIAASLQSSLGDRSVKFIAMLVILMVAALWLLILLAVALAHVR